MIFSVSVCKMPPQLKMKGLNINLNQVDDYCYKNVLSRLIELLREFVMIALPLARSVGTFSLLNVQVAHL